MSFAEKQLAKFGWKSGDGLGKNKDGIKKSISVTKKNDTKGLGGKLDKWDFAWWDHVFNKSVSNIQVNKDESGEVKVEKQAPSDIQTSRMGIISTSRPAGPSRAAVAATASSSTNSSGSSSPTTMGSMTPRDDYADDSTESKPAAPVAKSGPSWLFGFVKASASSEATEESKKTNKEFTTSAESFAARAGAEYDAAKAAEGDAYKDYSIKVSDKELFEACEGRTARKGARGEQPGKLGRVTKELLIEDGSEKPKKTTTTAAAKEKKEKKEAKQKKEKKEKKEKKSKADKKQPKEKKERKEKKDKKDKNEVKEAKEKKEKKTKKEKKDKEEKKSKKRSADEDEPRPSKKSKKEKSI
ncbi:G patch domain-containing protein 4 [Mortierella sp. GBA35]|nr:G patch domain-containing protein 4 [Mortierella sp. GBA35]